MRWSGSSLALVLGLAVPNVSLAQAPDMTKLFDFRSEVRAEALIVNDGVMGGRSSSRFEAAREGYGVFSGTVSLENNGGFASFRLPLGPTVMMGATKVVLRVRGDGQRYQVRLRSGRRWDGVAFAAGFDTTAGRWSTVELPLSDFEPSFRGYRPRGVGPVDPAEVGQVGIMITDKQAGPFRLEIEWIGVDRGGEPGSDAGR